MLKFYLGASGAGKSTKLYQDIIERSIKETERNFLIIVPDQFTMQTQMDIVKMHPAHGIMNIDVLSFGRLAHRVFDEVGTDWRQADLHIDLQKAGLKWRYGTWPNGTTRSSARKAARWSGSTNACGRCWTTCAKPRR